MFPKVCPTERKLSARITVYLDNQQARLGTKGELLINRDLTKYINQLRCAKIVCERNMTVHGGRSYLLVDANANQNTLAHRKVNNSILAQEKPTFYLDPFTRHDLKLHHWSIAFTSIFRNTRYSCIDQVRKNLFCQMLYFLYDRFWYDIWKLREGKRGKRYFIRCSLLRLAPSNERHRVATNIYKLYITSFGSAVRDEIDNPTVSQMERFLVGEQVRRSSISSDFLPVSRISSLNQMRSTTLKHLCIVY